MIEISSTNRNNASERHVSDYYVTPINRVEDFINEFIKYEPNIFNGKILDCCAGGDVLHPMSYPTAIKNIFNINVDTIDIRNDSLANIKADYLDYKCSDKYDLIITNPPFNLAREIIEKAIDDTKDGGYIIMLLRLNFFGGKLRMDLWDKHMPKYVFVYNRRVSFQDDGKTDSIEYMHCVWQKGYSPAFTKLKVI